jgi:two-component sensor histidine kinase/PAS domain-containing protein/CheY-like chemotaxis protein
MAAASGRSAGAEGSQGLVGDRKTLLLVEDDAVIGLSESIILRQEGYEVIHVFSGEEAVEAMSAEPCPADLVLMDINLGAGMDGTEAAELILLRRDIPLVFLSSHTEKEVVEKTEGITNYGYIVKNSGPTVLFTSIKMAFKLHEARMGLERSLAERRRIEKALEERLVALTSPLEEGGAALRLEDLFNIEELQEIQDAFAKATGVASLITDVAGHPITRASSFCRLCEDFVRPNSEGRARCEESDSALGLAAEGGGVMRPCLSAGLWDGGTSIMVGDRIVARWLIGQVLDEDADLDKLASYAAVIGADPAAYREALEEVPRMPKGRFQEVCQALSLFARQLSRLAFQNVQQARYISERKAAEETLRASEASLLRAEEAARIGSWSFDLGAGTMEASDGAKRLYGIPHNKDLIANVQKVPLPEYRPLLDGALKDLVEKGKPYDLEFKIRRPSDGRILDIHSSATYDRALNRVFGVIRDVSDRHRELELLRESEAHFREIFQNAAIALLEEDFSGAKRRLDALRAGGVADLEGWLEARPDELCAIISEVRIIHMNMAYRRLLGLGPSTDLSGMSIDVLPTVEPDRLLREFVTFMEGSLSYTEDMGLERRGSKEVALKLLLAIPPEHAEDWSRVFVSFIDMTTEKQQERRLESLVRDKETLMKELEHRVKNSLTLISSLFSLEMDRLPEGEARRVFEEAEERVSTVTSIYDLLSHSSDATSLDSREQIGELVRLFSDTWLGEGARIAITTDVESLPIAIKQAASIGLIINELLTNSLKYAFPSGQPGRIQVTFRRDGQDLRIAVEDNGVGLPPGFDLARSERLGFRLVELLASQYGGRLDLGPGKAGGLRAEVVIPAQAPESGI